MVKDETMLLRQKIRDTCDILRREVPSEIATAILEGNNPPDTTYRALKERTRRLLAKRVNGQWVLENKPGSGSRRTILTPKGLGRIKRMRKKSCRQIQSFTEGSPAQTISKSSAHRGKLEVRHTFFR